LHIYKTPAQEEVADFYNINVEDDMM
jgi:hypothetical protein